ncbi:MAG: hypothetical protein ABSE99_18425 [Terracidiphilus sp.]
MTPVSELLDPSSNAELYVASVLTFYLDMPDTPLRTSTMDQRQARTWFQSSVSVSIVETALLLGSLRRVARPRDLPPLPRIRSLAYFQPVIEELLANPAPDGYLPYLRFRLRRIMDKAESDPAPGSMLAGSEEA